MTANLYAEVVLPLPLSGTFTYQVPADLADKVKVGHRVLVSFGRKKFYTAIVASLTNRAPEGYEVKPLLQALDDEPVVRRPQMQLWEWMADYYLCSVGDVMRAALPAAMKVESETRIECNPDFEESPEARLSEREVLIVQALQHADKQMSVADIEKATGLTGVSATATRLLDKGAVMISEKLVERYRSRTVSYVRMAIDRNDSEALHRAFDEVGRAQKQQQALLALLDLSGFMRPESVGPLKEVTVEELLERSKVTRPILKALADRKIVEIYKKEINRFRATGLATGQLPELSEAQSAALASIHESWRDHDVTLLRGVTSSGKTELYIHLINRVMNLGRQALFLVPEIALTTQLTRRLQNVFGDKVVIYHSKFSDNERVDIYRKVLGSREPMVVIGARSALFLPFADLGLVIVDEEHESSYKQQDPAPRYNGRDTAMVLARMHGAKTLLGSATPTIESYYKALNGRYGLVELLERFGGVALPEVRLINTNAARRRKEMVGALASETLSLVRDAVESPDGQAIVFLNRRGYAPVAECKMCAYVPKCEHCDVSLTYHKRIDRLVCHYCGSLYPLPTVCPACHEPAVEIHGYGTERMEDEVEQALPDVKTLRMDLDTTRNKDAYENIITDFSQGKAKILVGTQMVTKGLDFGNVRAVAVVNADAIVNQPDFRATERAFNMIQQVSGRAGRREQQGVVAIQTRTPEHPLYRFALSHDYLGFYNDEIEERRRYAYPPFTRVIYIYLKHRDRRMLDELSVAYVRRLQQLFGNRVFGPEEPTVSRIQTLYIRKVMLKIEVEASMKKVKDILRATLVEMHSSNASITKGAIVYYDVDPC